MSRKIVCGIGWLVLVCATFLPVEAATQSYNAVVTFSSGPQSALVPAGERVVISYTLDPLAVDSNADPQLGQFRNAVLSLSVTFPDLEVFAIAGPTGNAQTANNIKDQTTGNLSDQVAFFGGPVFFSSLLGGESISFLEVGFLSDFITPPGQPAMLSSDALPLFALPTNDATLFLRTSSGFTQVDFEARPTLQDCTPGATTLCLNNGRFRVEAVWRTEDGKTGFGQAVPLTADTGYIWFFNSANIEILVKVLNACSFGYYWVFAGGLTNVQVVLTVTDTETREVRTYVNLQGEPFQPIQDTRAFATCP